MKATAMKVDFSFPFFLLQMSLLLITILLIDHVHKNIKLLTLSSAIYY
jgi:hypothetical protein